MSLVFASWDFHFAPSLTGGSSATTVRHGGRTRLGAELHAGVAVKSARRVARRGWKIVAVISVSSNGSSASTNKETIEFRHFQYHNCRLSTGTGRGASGGGRGRSPPPNITRGCLWERKKPKVEPNDVPHVPPCVRFTRGIE